MRILMVTAELAPLAKVGGLADATAALAGALARRGHDVRVVLPLYGDLDRAACRVRPLRKLPALPLRVGQGLHAVRLHRQGSGSSAVKIYLAECPALFGRAGIYTDDAGVPFTDAWERALLHAQAALALPLLLDWAPDVLHAHDAAAAPAISLLARWGGKAPPWAGTGSLLTIHNLAHQMVLPRSALASAGLPAELGDYPSPFEFHGQINVLKAGILHAGLVNTVSATYAAEVVRDEEMGCGLAGVLRSRGADFSGILNGADYAAWNPARDPHLAARFSAEQPAGRAACRAALAAELRLPDDGTPLASFVGRLVEQKGLDLILPRLDALAADGLRLAFLGTGEARYERQLAAAAASLPGRVAFVGRFDEALARRVYAGSDLFLMPSRFEPCGLAQLYALRYGTVPVVRRTGGLADTVSDASDSQGTGFVFDAYRPAALRGALARARRAWRDRDLWGGLQRRGMAARFSWDAAAEAYEDLYRRLRAGAPARGGAAATAVRGG